MRRNWRLVFIFLAILVMTGCNSNMEHRILVWNTMRPVEREYLQELLDKFGERYPEYEFRQLYYEPEELRTNFIIAPPFLLR